MISNPRLDATAPCCNSSTSDSPHKKQLRHLSELITVLESSFKEDVAVTIQINSVIAGPWKIMEYLIFDLWPMGMAAFPCFSWEWLQMAPGSPTSEVLAALSRVASQQCP